MNGDKLVIELGAARYAVPTAEVAGIVSAGNVPFLPGQSGMVRGIISLRNEPVTVVDLVKVFAPEAASEAEHGGRVIVVKDKHRLIGLAIGTSPVSFMWDEGAGQQPRREEAGRFTAGVLGPENDPVWIIDWRALFTEATRILSTEEKGG